MQTNMKKKIAIGLIGLSFGAVGAKMSTSAIDCKGTDCEVKVMVSEQNFKDAIYYTPAEWNAKTANDIAKEKTDRYNKWKLKVDEMSKRTQNEED